MSINMHTIMHTINYSKEKAMHTTHIAPCTACNPLPTMLERIRTMRPTQVQLMSLIHEGHDLHTTTHAYHQSNGTHEWKPYFFCTTHLRVCLVEKGQHYPYNPYTPKHMEAPMHTPIRTTNHPLHPSHTEVPTPMHYKVTLNTHTTMAWLILCTLSTLMWWVARAYIHTPTWGGIHTLLTVGAYMSLVSTAIMALIHRYVRKYGPITLSTRDLGL